MRRNTHPFLRSRARSATASTDGPRPVPTRSCAVPPVRLPRPLQPPGEDLSVDIRWDAPGPVLAVAGALDTLGRDLLEAVLLHVRRSRPGPIAVDLAGVSFVDTQGFSPVLAPDVVLVAASPAVRRLLRLLGLPLPGLRHSHGPAGRRDRPRRVSGDG